MQERKPGEEGRRGRCGHLDHAEVGRAAIAGLDEAHIPGDDVLGVDHLALAAADHRGLGGEHPLDRIGCLLGAPLLDEACGKASGCASGPEGCMGAMRGVVQSRVEGCAGV